MENRPNISLSEHYTKCDSLNPNDSPSAIIHPANQDGDRNEVRLQAVMALLSGEAIELVQERFRMSRSSLYDYKQRAIAAMREALQDQKRGTDKPHNKTKANDVAAIKEACERNPKLSSYQIKERLGANAPMPRTIQRIRKRMELPRFKKREEPSSTLHHFTKKEKKLIRRRVEEKIHLGGLRLSWDLNNADKLKVSASTVKRIKQAVLEERNPSPEPIVWQFYERKHPHSLWHGDFFEKVTLTDEDRTAYQLALLDDYSRTYVFCDLFREVSGHTTIRAMIAAMRQYQTIPKAVVFDNGSPFSNALLSAFCNNLGIRLIHSSIAHPQTNGKLERAFRDDRREYYNLFDGWYFDELREGLPEYVRYRNEIRGHYALRGKPATTRLKEQHFFALPSVLERLESFARYEKKSQKVDICQSIRVLGRNGHLPGTRYGEKMRVFETLDGLEAHAKDGRIFFLKDFATYRQMHNDCRRKKDLPFCFKFVPLNFSVVDMRAIAREVRKKARVALRVGSPGIAVAL